LMSVCKADIRMAAWDVLPSLIETSTP
jgi:hypothetical protein